MKSFVWILGLSLALELSALPAQAGCNSWKRKPPTSDQGYGNYYCPAVEFDEFSNCDEALQTAQRIKDKLLETHKDYEITLGSCYRTVSSLKTDFTFDITFKRNSGTNLDTNDCSPFRDQLSKNPTFVKNVCKKENDNTEHFMKYVSPEVEAGQDQSILATPKDSNANKGN